MALSIAHQNLATQAAPLGLANRAVAAIRRNNGTLLLPGAATPVAGGGFTYGNPPLRNYLDSAGTDILDSVTQVDQPVGLCLDSMGVLGADVVGLSTSWQSLGAGFALSGGVMTLTSAATSAFALKGVGLTASKTYQFDVVVSSLSGGSIQIQTNNNAFTISAAGTYTFIHKPGAIDGPYVAVTSGTVSAQITRLDWREIPGNHASQPTTASKPILRRGLVNQLLDNQGASGTYLTASGVTTAATSIAGYANSVQFPATATTSTLYKANTLTAATVYTFAAIVQMDDGSAPVVPVSVMLGDFCVQVNNAPAGADSVTNIGGSVYMVVKTFTATPYATSGLVRYNTQSAKGFRATSYAIFTGTVTASQILAAGGIPLTSAVPASSAMGNYWWQFDGSNDSFSTGITTGNEGWVCAGVTPANTTTAMSIVNAGEGTSTIPGVWLFNSGTGSWTASAADGSLRTQTTSPVLGTAPQVVSMGWTASTLTVGVNNTEVSTPKISAGSWSSGANVLRIGAYQGSSVPLNGPMSAKVYCTIYPSAADRALIRRFVGSLQGQTL